MHLQGNAALPAGIIWLLQPSSSEDSIPRGANTAPGGASHDARSIGPAKIPNALTGPAGWTLLSWQGQLDAESDKLKDVHTTSKCSHAFSLQFFVIIMALQI